MEDESEVAHLPYTSCEAKSVVGGTSSSSRKQRTDIEWIEHQAKYFSAAALMPRKTMRMLCADPKVQQFCFGEHPGYENDALIAMVSKVYNVSFESARIRIKELGQAYISPRPAPDSYFLS